MDAINGSRPAYLMIAWCTAVGLTGILKADGSVGECALNALNETFESPVEVLDYMRHAKEPKPGRLSGLLTAGVGLLASLGRWAFGAYRVAFTPGVAGKNLPLSDHTAFYCPINFCLRQRTAPQRTPKVPVNDPISRVGGTKSPEDAHVGNSASPAG